MLNSWIWKLLYNKHENFNEDHAIINLCTHVVFKIRVAFRVDIKNYKNYTLLHNSTPTI